MKSDIDKWTYIFAGVIIFVLLALAALAK